ncbi:MAG TPA: pilus assembly protein TadG-related protein [Acidimicrobiia bacterium]
MVHDLRRRVLTRTRDGRADERGAILIMVAIFMVMMLAFAALVIDLGNARQQRRQMKAAADASAVAGVEEMASIGANFSGSPSQWTQVVNEVKAYARENFQVASDDWPGCTDPDALSYRPDAGNGCISADYGSWPTPAPGETSKVNRLRVRIPQRAVQTAFAGAIDRDGLVINAVSIAAVTRTKSSTTTEHTETVAGAPCALCVLGPGLSFDGQNGDLSVTGGDAIVNSDPPSGDAAALLSNGHLRVLNGAQIGGPGAPGKFSGSGYSPSPITLDPVEDPLADVPQCGTGSTCPTNSATDSGSTLNPGIYTRIRGSHTLNPGIYVLKGDIELSGNDLLRGNGVMLYFACSNYPNPCSALPAGSRNGARIKATGNGAVLLSPPTTGTYQGLTIFADRDNTSLTTIRGNGTNESGGTSGSSGTIYIKGGILDLRGNGYTLSSLVVVGFVALNGNPAGVTIWYNQDVNYHVTHTVTTVTSTDAYSYDASGLIG